jgi:murein DD-endopeptidase MepM/ murein hydrolase activator NlpD
MFTVLFEPASKVLASEIVTPTIPPNEVVNAADITTEHTVVWPVKSPSITQGYRLGHYGVDIQDKANLSIYPVDDGVITGIEDSRFGYGKHVYIDHGDGRSSLYAHLSSINVVVGQQVNRDTIIGIMGKTGWASGIHLHLEIYQNGKALNPVTLLPTLSQTIASVQK